MDNPIINPYAALGVPVGASIEEVTLAWRKMAARYHPDRNPDADAEHHFAQARTAYEILSDPARKKTIDARLSDGLDQFYLDSIREMVDQYVQTSQNR